MGERSYGTHKVKDKVAENSLNSYSLDQALADLLDGGGSLPFSDEFSVPDSSPLSSSGEPFSYSWQKPNSASINQETKNQSFTKDPPSTDFGATLGTQVDSPSSPSSISPRSTASMSKLSEELENLRAEHRDINEISDQLAVKGQYAGGIQFQLVALKKRKLYLRDRIRSLELQLESLLRDSILEDESSSKESKSSTDPVGTVLSEMMKRLRDLGLKPEQVPPHKDSFFLSLMKSLQRVGLRPNGYDFREGAVLGAERQFPSAAKRARFDVLKLLSSQADKLNGIGGWKLSSEEFQRYFAKSWWTLPAARDDLFMASAHLYSVRIVVFSIEAERLDEQVYDPPGAQARATVYLCRRDAHVISTAPLVKGAGQISVLPELQQKAKESAPDVEQRLPPLSPVVEEPKRLGRKLGLAKEDLDAGLGLLDHVLESDDNYQVEEEVSMSAEAFEDDEVVEDRASADRRAGSMYGAPVRTRRVFVAVTLEPEARAAVAGVAAGLRRDFPLDARLLDGAVRWVDPEAYHVTLDALDVDPANLAPLVAAVGRAVEAARQGPFAVRTGALGSFWRSAGSGWGRVPRVVWLGLDGAGAGPLLRLREAVDAACGGLASGSGQGFCAHITLGKTRARGGDGLAAAERRALRALGKWVQDPQRPLALQQILAGAPATGGADAGGGGGGGRGGKRARSWLRQVDVGTLSGRQKQAMTKQLRKSGRDLGALNAQLASDFVGDAPPADDDGDVPAGDGPAAAAAAEGKAAGVEIVVEAVSVIEAVPVAGTGRVRYTILERFELPS